MLLRYAPTRGPVLKGGYALAVCSYQSDIDARIATIKLAGANVQALVDSTKVCPPVCLAFDISVFREGVWWSVLTCFLSFLLDFPFFF